MNAPTTFGTWLKQRRTTLGLTQEELAECASCSDVMVRKIELGSRRPSRQVAGLLAECLKVPEAERPAFVEFARGNQAAQPGDFSPQRASTYPSNLPAPLTPLVGRAREVAQLRESLLSREVRLLTLTGPPGIGKTRLSLEVAAELADQFRDGAYFVPLAPISDPGLVAATIGRVLGIEEETGSPVLHTLAYHLRDKRILLVLDNFEQIAQAGPVVADLLLAASGVKALVTSREVLLVRGEHRFELPPLELPAQPLDVEALASYAAIELFVQRAQAVRPDFALTPDNAEAVAAICARLDGLPLAIELAAARTRLLSPQEIQERLAGRLPLLWGGPRDLPARQQTLRAAIDWSYNLLAPGEQTLYSRLGVFVGGCTLSAAEGVCNPQADLPFDVTDGLEMLIDKSLVRSEGPRAGVHVRGESRFWMLETLREHALERLRENEEDVATGRYHAEFFLALAEAGDAELRGARQVEWLERLDRDHNNMRAALHWLRDRGDVESELRLCAALGWFWELRGYITEGREWVGGALERGEAAGASGSAYARALNTAGRLSYRASDLANTERLLKESLRHAREADDKWCMVVALHNLGNAVEEYEANDEVRKYHEESLAVAREIDDKWGICWGLMGVGHAATAEGNYAEARSMYAESLALRREMNDAWGVARSLRELGIVAYLQGDYEEARPLFEESLKMHRDLGHAGFLPFVLPFLAVVALYQQDYEYATANLVEIMSVADEQGYPEGITFGLEGLGIVASAQGHTERAATLLGAAQALKASGSQYDPMLAFAPAERSPYERQLADAHAGLQHADLQVAWARGKAMSVNEARAYARETTLR
jgi:predicted ATPase/DNA-binding XRE family transcriptional regulator